MLTEEQAETIQQPDAAKLICALPGSGKTHTFISLVEKILAVDSRYTVLMVTFTNASAKEMFDRVQSRLGRAAAKRVKAATFASLMLGQFRPIAKGRKPIIGPEQYSFVRRALSEAKVMYDDLDEWVSKIERLGRELHVNEDGTPSFRVFKAYTDILHRYKRYDLNMMARELIAGMNEGTIPPYPHTHVLTDEFQDVDNLQYYWLKALGDKGKKLAVVGDDDQSIYHWRGSLGYKAFVQFQEDFDADGFLLSMCFRCKGNILHAARGLIEHNVDRIPKDMRSIKEKEGVVKLVTIPRGYISELTQQRLLKDQPEALVKALNKAKKKSKESKEEEDLERFRFVAERIKKSNEEGWAVLARTNKQLDAMEQVLAELEMDCIRIGGKSIFDNEDAIGIISLFLGVSSRRYLTELTTGLSWLGASEEKISKIYQTSQLYGFAGAQIPNKESQSGKYIQYFQELSQQASRFNDNNANKFIQQFFKAVMRVVIQKNSPTKSLQSALVDICKNIALKADGKVENKAKAVFLRSQGAASNKDIKNTSAVILSTMNSSKGLEWQRVWCIEVEDGKMPSLKDTPEGIEAELEAERRLLYVAMTRAEEELYISFREGKESEFIGEIAVEYASY